MTPCRNPSFRSEVPPYSAPHTLGLRSPAGAICSERRSPSSASARRRAVAARSARALQMPGARNPAAAIETCRSVLAGIAMTHPAGTQQGLSPSSGKSRTFRGAFNPMPMPRGTWRKSSTLRASRVLPDQHGGRDAEHSTTGPAQMGRIGKAPFLRCICPRHSGHRRTDCGTDALP